MVDRELATTCVNTALNNYRANQTAIAQLEARATNLQKDMAALNFSSCKSDGNVQCKQGNVGTLAQYADDHAWYIERARTLRRQNTFVRKWIQRLERLDPLAAEALSLYYCYPVERSVQEVCNALGLSRSAYFRLARKARGELVDVAVRAHLVVTDLGSATDAENLNTDEKDNGDA